jgi:hypothetical protein
MVARRTTSPCKCRTRACVQERVAGTKHVAHAGYLKTGKLVLSLLAMITANESSGPALNRRGSSSLSGVERGTLILNSSIVLRLMVSTISLLSSYPSRSQRKLSVTKMSAPPSDASSRSTSALNESTGRNPHRTSDLARSPRLSNCTPGINFSSAIRVATSSEPQTSLSKMQWSTVVTRTCCLCVLATLSVLRVARPVIPVVVSAFSGNEHMHHRAMMPIGTYRLRREHDMRTSLTEVGSKLPVRDHLVLLAHSTPMPDPDKRCR